jgi:hypothetical protein
MVAIASTMPSARDLSSALTTSSGRWGLRILKDILQLPHTLAYSRHDDSPHRSLLWLVLTRVIDGQDAGDGPPPDTLNL